MDPTFATQMISALRTTDEAHNKRCDASLKYILLLEECYTNALDRCADLEKSQSNPIISLLKTALVTAPAVAVAAIATPTVAAPAVAIAAATGAIHVATK